MEEEHASSPVFATLELAQRNQDLGRPQQMLLLHAPLSTHRLTLRQHQQLLVRRAHANQGFAQFRKNMRQILKLSPHNAAQNR